MSVSQHRLPPLSRLECQILLLLWRQAPLTLQELHGQIRPQQRVGIRAVSTALGQLETKGCVARARKGRTCAFRPTIKIEDVIPGWRGTVVRHALANEMPAMMSDLVDLLQRIAGGRGRLRRGLGIAESAWSKGRSLIEMLTIAGGGRQ